MYLSQMTKLCTQYTNYYYVPFVEISKNIKTYLKPIIVNKLYAFKNIWPCLNIILLQCNVSTSYLYYFTII